VRPGTDRAVGSESLPKSGTSLVGLQNTALLSDCLFSTRVEDPAYARHVVRSTFEGISPWAVATAELLASELVTNAIVYGVGDPTLLLDLRQAGLHVEVHDSGLAVDLAPLNVGPTSVHGRGLDIVDALASSWGVESRPVGKAVWFDLNL
jgi:hypothetical protein